MSIFKKLKYWLFPCKHTWVQGAEYWHNKTGGDYDYLLPKPMKYNHEYQSNCYVCEKCGESIVTIEKIKISSLMIHGIEDEKMVDGAPTNL